MRNDPLILSLSEKYKCTPNQITLGWHIARGVYPVPRSHNAERQKENLSVSRVSRLSPLPRHACILTTTGVSQPAVLEPEDVESISALDRGQRLCNKPENGAILGWTVEQLGW